MARLQFSAVAPLAALLCILSIAQGGTTLEVKFYVPGGRVPTTTRAELISGEGTPVGETMVDVSGTVRFGMLRDGNYSVHVSGPGIEAAIYEVRLMPAESTHVEMFQLRPLRESTAGPNSYPGVSALDLDAPPKARKEIEKANQALKEHDWGEARERCEKAIEIYPKFVSAYNELGVVLIRLGERHKARRALQEAINLDPNFARPFINLARMNAADRNFVEAEKLLIKAASDDPKNPETMFLLANAEFENAHYDEAIATARKLNALPHRGFEAAHYICAAALEAQHRPSEAAREYRAFLQEAPDSKMAPNARAALQSLADNTKTQ